MKSALHFLLAILVITACSKTNDGRVEIYLLDSFELKFDSSSNPWTMYITNGKLAAEPLVSNGDIIFYSPATYTFTLNRNVQSSITTFGGSNAFAVCVDKQVVYYGRFHPAYLSSLTLGLATIDPVTSDRRLTINFVQLESARPNSPDKRNDRRLLAALTLSNRLQ